MIRFKYKDITITTWSLEFKWSFFTFNGGDIMKEKKEIPKKKNIQTSQKPKDKPQ